MNDHVLIVDDDPELRALLADYLGRNGLRVSEAEDGVGLRNALEVEPPDLVILDVMLPGEDGLSLCRNLRAHSALPVIMLTARGDDTDRIVGLEMGADDYLPKPFNPRELLARINSVLRRTRGTGDAGTATTPPHGDGRVRRYRFAGWLLDAELRQLIDADGVVVPLGSAEFRLLRALLEHAGRPQTRDQLLDATQGREAGPFDRSIDMLISRLRRRLREDPKEPAIIRTLRNEGYVLVAPITREF